MRTMKHLALAAMTAAALALVGCGGGGGSSSTPPSGPTVAERMMKQRNAISAAIMKAETAVAAVMDDSTDAVVGAADTAIADARAAITAATDVPEQERTANSGTVNALASRLTAAKSSRKTAMDDRMKAGAKDAMALFNGIDESTSDLTVTGIEVTDKHGGGMASVTATGLTPGVGKHDDLMKSAEPMLGMWQGTMLTRAVPAGAATNAGTSSTVVVYTDIEAAKSVAFGKVYDLDDNGNLASATVTATGNRSKIKASAFVHTGKKDHAPKAGTGDDAVEVAVRGSFNGASGEYRCSATAAGACVSHDAGKGAVRLAGTWIFDPDSGAMAMMADANYLYFGWWLNKGTTEGVEAGTFHGVTDGTGDAELLATPENINTLGGSATYKGAAAGKYAINPGLSMASGGHWTANATLTAEWGSETEAGMISGMVDGFMAGGQSMDWNVKLGKTALNATGGFETDAANDTVVWTIGGVAGAKAGSSWDVQLRAAGDNGVPTVGTGEFSATHGTVGHILGAFGAHLEK